MGNAYGLDWRMYSENASTTITRLSPLLQKREINYEFSELLLNSISSANEQIASGNITRQFSSAEEMIQSLNEPDE